MSHPQITMYTTSGCGDCRRAKQFLKERGVEFREINIDESTDAEDLVMRVDEDLRKVPTFEVGGRYFSCSPFDPYKLSEELNIPLNP
jgi:glutaredoxin